jgi:hypothetical protein
MAANKRLEAAATCARGMVPAAAAAVAVMLAPASEAHHSFAMYDLQITKVFTGVVSRVNPAPNHLQIFFAPMNEQRKNVERDAKGEPIIWSVEMEGAAPMARQGISVDSFAPGTVFSVALHPLRSGDTAGTRAGGIFKCPERVRPAPGMHCDSVPGSMQIGTEPLPSPRG